MDHLRELEAPDGGVLVHCAIGKDRTGILVALILAALGSPDRVIIEDYTRTGEADFTAFHAAELARIDDPERRARLVDRMHARPDTIAGLLAHVDERFGGAAAYLRINGLVDSELQQLATRLTCAQKEAESI